MKKNKKLFPSWKEKPFFELIITVSLFAVALVLGLISIFLKDSLGTNQRDQLVDELITFFIWFFVLFFVSMLGNLFILFRKQNPKEKRKNKNSKIKGGIK